MIALIIAFSIFSSTYQMQKKYDFCKAENFKHEYCELQKKMSKFEKK